MNKFFQTLDFPFPEETALINTSDWPNEPNTVTLRF